MILRQMCVRRLRLGQVGVSFRASVSSSGLVLLRALRICISVFSGDDRRVERSTPNLRGTMNLKRVSDVLLLPTGNYHAPHNLGFHELVQPRESMSKGVGC